MEIFVLIISFVVCETKSDFEQNGDFCRSILALKFSECLPSVTMYVVNESLLINGVVKGGSAR